MDGLKNPMLIAEHGDGAVVGRARALEYGMVGINSGLI